MTDIIQQVKQEYEIGLDYIRPKKSQVIKRLERHLKQNKTSWMVNFNMISNIIDTLIAWSYTTEPRVKFISRDMMMESEQAETLNYMAKFDYTERDYQQLDYQVERDRYFFWLGIKYKHWMDTTRMTPIFYAVNPITAIYDPTPTMLSTYTVNNYKFFWFEMVANLFDLKNDPQYDKEALKKILRWAIDWDTKLYQQAISISNNTNYVVDNLLLNCSIQIYHHFTIVDGRKTIITVDSNTKKILLRNKTIEAVTKDEKKNPSLIPRPFSFYFYKPERWNPFWVSIPDQLEDKEEAKTILYNASLIKANKEAFWWKFLVNSRLIKNKNDLLKPSTWPQYIFTNDLLNNESLGNAMMELPSSPIKQDVLTLASILDNEARQDTKIDQMQMWIVPDKTMTKAEQQSVQANANMFQSLNHKTYLRWEYDFRFLRWRTYQEFFSQSDEKLILMNQDFEFRSIAVKKDQFNTKQNPYIVVWSASDLDAINEKQRMYWNAVQPIINSDPNIPQVSKLLVNRLTAKLNWMPQNMINSVYFLTPTERKARQYVEYFINKNIVPKSLFTSINDDYQTYWIYFQKADDTEAKTKVLNILEQYLLATWQQAQTKNFEQMANSSSNILMSQLWQQSDSSVLSRNNNNK